MIIAIPSVTRYISDSRKSAYVDTAKEIIGGARNIVNGGKLEMYSTNTTYYIPTSCIKTENAQKSPYGDFTQAYVGVIYDGKGYKYYWISVDDAGQGVSKITPLDKLDTEIIESDLKASDIEGVVQTTGIGNRSEIKILDCSTNSWNRQYQLDNTSNNASEEDGGGSSSGGSGGSGGTTSNIVCKSATTLHQKTCERASNGCGATIGNGNTITYGTLVSGNPKAGDAYDCDVNNDGTYDSATERFYYVGSSGSNSILIYYKNMNDQTTYAYDISNKNWYGPRTGYQYLPSTSTWSNPGLIAPGTRSIVAENGNGSTSGGTIESFTYTDKAARFLTAQEVNSACGITVGINTTGELDGCIWLMENVGQYETSSGSYGYWLETPRSDFTYIVWYVNGNNRNVNYSSADNTLLSGVRPVITIITSNISN